MLGSIFLAACTLAPANLNDIHLKGFVADRLNACIERHVERTDSLYLTRFFHARQATWTWQTEFWGKWMLSAVPFADYADSPILREKIAQGMDDLLSTQDADGYIGNYRPSCRYAPGTWDVWGTKYVLLGLLASYEHTHEVRTLDAAERLAQYLMAHFRTRPLYKSGWYRGLPSCSVLSPIVRLYRLTRKQDYLDFAKEIRDQMDAEDGARLLTDADVPLFSRVTKGGLDSSLKAYEMMDCYLGLLDLYEVTGERRLLEAVRCTAEHILAEEINIIGGASSGEHWYAGASRQTEPYNRPNETCVLTTWMRLCERLYRATGETRYLDALERTFYNAYLATLAPDGSVFSQYCPLSGTRATGEHHNKTFTNCCNANGPRGFLAFLGSLLAVSNETVNLNLYAGGDLSVALPNGRDVRFQVYTRYPENGEVTIWYRSEKANEFTFAPRIPGWCENYSASVNGQGVRFPLRRTWSPGDEIRLQLEMPVKLHQLNGSVAFTRGPIVLARDSRFGGDLSDVMRPAFAGDGSGETSVPDVRDLKLDFRQVRSDNPQIWMKFAAVLPMGFHAESTRDALADVVEFCDFASAANTWSKASSCRVWMPLLQYESHR